MDLSGDIRIPAPRQRVWDALNDPDVLRQAVPGCEALEKLSDTEFTARVVLKIGPVKAAFTGKVTLSDLDPPNSYTIKGEGQGGVAGFANGGATVRLADDGDGTLLSYEAQSMVGGKLAQVGQRVIKSASEKLAGEFFERFSAAVAEAGEAPAEAVAAPESPPEVTAPPSGLSPWVWIGGVLVLVAALLFYFGY